MGKCERVFEETTYQYDDAPADRGGALLGFAVVGFAAFILGALTMHVWPAVHAAVCSAALVVMEGVGL